MVVGSMLNSTALRIGKRVGAAKAKGAVAADARK